MTTLHDGRIRLNRDHKCNDTAAIADQQGILHNAQDRSYCRLKFLGYIEPSGVFRTDRTIEPSGVPRTDRTKQDSDVRTIQPSLSPLVDTMRMDCKEYIDPLTNAAWSVKCNKCVNSFHLRCSGLRNMSQYVGPCCKAQLLPSTSAHQVWLSQT